MLPDSYDPYNSDSFESMPVIKNIYAPLVSTFLDGKPQGMIAESWKISQDGKTWSFKIRKGLVFSDGTPITPAVVLQSFRRILWLTRKSGLALNHAISEVAEWNDYAAPLKSLYIDKDSLVFKFSTQPEDLFESLEKPLYAIVNSVCFDEKGIWKEKQCLYESGQFKIVNQAPGKIILQNRHVFPEAPHAPETVEFIAKTYSTKTRLDWTLENRTEILLSGNLVMGKNELKKISEAGYKVLPEPPLRMQFLRLNHKRAPFNDKTLRQSIRDTFLSLLANDPNFISEIELNPSFVPPGGMGYIPITPPVRPVKCPDMKGIEIKAIILEVKPPDNPQSKLEKYNKALESALYKTMELHNIKLNATRDYAGFHEIIKRGDFDLMFSGSGLSVQEPYEALRMMFMSDVGANIPDPSGLIPGYILKGLASQDPATRKKYAEKINRTIFDEAAAITYTHTGLVYVYSPEVDMSHVSTFSDPIEFRAVSWAPESGK